MRFVFFVLSCYLCCALPAQPLQQKILDNSYSNDDILFTLPTANKGQLIGSRSYSPTTGFSTVCQLDSFGMVVWARQYRELSQFDTYFTTAINEGSGFLMAGVSNGQQSYLSIDLLKCDSVGNIVWSKSWRPDSSIGGPHYPYLKPTSSGFVLAYSATVNKKCLYWFDHSGNRIRTKYFQGNSGFISGLETDVYDNVYIISCDAGAGTTCKLDSAGNVKWSTSVPGYWPYRLRQDTDGNLVGLFVSYNNCGTALVKLDTAGNRIWGAVITVDFCETGADFAISSTGDYFVAMNQSNNPSAYPFGPWAKIAKFRSDGVPLWVTAVDISSCFEFNKIEAVADRIAVIGKHAGAAYYNVFMAILDSSGSGCSQLTDSFSVVPFVSPTPSVLQPLMFNDSMVVRSWQVFPDTISQSTICITGIAEQHDEVLISIYPNPGDGNFTLSGSLLRDSRIEVYDMLGQQVHREDLPAGDLSQSLNLSAFASGVYVWKIIDVNGTRKNDRLIIVR